MGNICAEGAWDYFVILAVETLAYWYEDGWLLCGMNCILVVSLMMPQFSQCWFQALWQCVTTGLWNRSLLFFFENKTKKILLGTKKHSLLIQGIEVIVKSLISPNEVNVTFNFQAIQKRSSRWESVVGTGRDSRRSKSVLAANWFWIFIYIFFLGTWLSIQDREVTLHRKNPTGLCCNNDFSLLVRVYNGLLE